MPGIGTSSIGSTPFGFGTPVEAPEPADLSDRARFVDPATKSYSLASDGEYQRMPLVRQKVILALTTNKGSSSVLPEFGLKLERKIDDSFVQRQEQNVRDALAHIPVNEMTLTGVLVELVPPTGRSRITVSYNDLIENITNQSVTV